MEYIPDIKAIDEKLKNALDEKRYNHSIGVRDEAKRMAELFGADISKALIAGFVHDCAKRMSFRESIQICEKYGVLLDDITKLCPPVIHAPAGAVIAEREYGILDKEILDAIRFHTVARAGMTLLDKIIYVADMTEPQRDFDGVEKLRKLSETDINLAYQEAIRLSLVFNLCKGNLIHPNTLYAWNETCKNKLK